MVHVIQTHPASPSLLTAKAICHLGDPSGAFALHAMPGLLTAQTHQTSVQPAAQPLYNSGFFNLISSVSDPMLRPETWIGSAPFANTAQGAYNATLSHQNDGSVSDNNTIDFNQSSQNSMNTQKNDATSTRVSSIGDDEKNPSDSYHIFVGDLAPDVEDEVLLAAFAAFGNVTECKIIKDMHTQKPKGYGFVAYKTKLEAERAIQLMNGQIIGSRAIRTNWAVRRDPADQAKDHRPLNYIEVFNASSASNTTIYVGGITTGLTESLLHKAFEEFGEIKEVRIFRDKGFSFIRFDTHAAATRAIVTMHGRIVGNQSCKCSWGKEPTYSNRLHSANSNSSRSNSILIPPNVLEEPQRSNLIQSAMNVGPTLSQNVSNLSMFPGWPATLSQTGAVPFTKFDCISQLGMFANVLDSFPSNGTLENAFSLRTLNSDPYKLNANDLLSDASKASYWPQNMKDIESCLTTMVMNANSSLALSQQETGKFDLTKPVLSSMNIHEKYVHENGSNTSALLTSGQNSDRFSALQSVNSNAPNGSNPISLSCDLSNPLLTETSSVSLHGLPTMPPGLLTLKPVDNKSLLSSYSLLSSVTPYGPNCSVQVPLSSSATKMNICDGTLQTTFSLANLDPITFALRNPPVMPVQFPLSDWSSGNAYGCGFLQPEIARPTLISNGNGVSLLC